MPTYLLSKDDKAEIVQLYKSGKGVKDIAKAHSVSRTAIYKVLKGADVQMRSPGAQPKPEPVGKRRLTPPPKNPPVADEAYEEMYKLRETGLKWNQIADMTQRRADNIMQNVRLWAIRNGKEWPVKLPQEDYL